MEFSCARIRQIFPPFFWFGSCAAQGRVPTPYLLTLISLTSSLQCVSIFPHTCMQVIGANGQGLANAILFCGFTKKVRKRLLTSARARCLHLKRLCCYCRCSAAKWRTSVSSSSDYDELVDSDDLDKRNDSSRNGTESQYGLLGDFSNTSISCNSLQDSQSQS